MGGSMSTILKSNIVPFYDIVLNKYVIASRITYNYLPINKSAWYTTPLSFIPTNNIITTDELNLKSTLNYTIKFDTIGVEGG